MKTRVTDYFFVYFMCRSRYYRKRYTLLYTYIKCINVYLCRHRTYINPSILIVYTQYFYTIYSYIRHLYIVYTHYSHLMFLFFLFFFVCLVTKRHLRKAKKEKKCTYIN